MIKKILFLFGAPLFLLGQSTGSINGYLQNKDTGEPLIYANVMLANTSIGTTSNVHGYYVIHGIPAGNYKLVISMMGFEKTEKDIVVKANSGLREDFEISSITLKGDEVVVTADRVRFKEKVEISRTNFSFKEILSTPSFIEADVFRTIQQLPSATSQNDFSSALIVRGGSPDENLIMVDGAEIYNPFHLGGLFSTFNADAISEADFYAGGYSADFTGRLSSVLNITSREGNSKNGKFFKNSDIGKYWDFSHVKGEISFLSSKALAEGPFYKGAWIFSGRRTYFDKISEFYKKSKDEDQNWKYYFWDNQFKLFSDINKKNRLTLSTFNGRDILDFIIGDTKENEDEINFDWEWGNNSNSLTWRFVPNSKFYSEFIVARSGFDFDLSLAIKENNEDKGEGATDETNFKVTNKIEDITITEKITWFATPKHTITMGASIKNLTLKFDFNLDNVNYFDTKRKPNVYSCFVQDKWKISNLLSLQLGLRVSDYELHDILYVDPRIGFKYLLTENLSLKGSWGIFNQFLFTLNDENEILHLVDFWEAIPKEFDAMTNQHFILGMEKWFNQGYSSSIEVYYKPYSNILTGNPNNDPAIKNDEFITGEATAYGLELLIKKNTGKLTGWIGCSISDIQREFDFNGDGKVKKTKNEMSEIYHPKYSKPITLNIVANYQMSKKNQFSLSCNASSGQPYTPVIGKVHDGNGIPGTPYSNLKDIYGQKNSYRYPMYLRFDLGYTRSISPFGLNGKFKFQIMNVTNHFNVLTYIWDHDKSPAGVKAVSMFPIFPSFGWEFEI